MLGIIRILLILYFLRFIFFKKEVDDNREAILFLYCQFLLKTVSCLLGIPIGDYDFIVFLFYTLAFYGILGQDHPTRLAMRICLAIFY